MVNQICAKLYYLLNINNIIKIKHFTFLGIERNQTISVRIRTIKKSNQNTTMNYLLSQDSLEENDIFNMMSVGEHVYRLNFNY